MKFIILQEMLQDIGILREMLHDIMGYFYFTSLLFYRKCYRILVFYGNVT